jgi:starch synthase (maltosyl-transferring)
MPQKALRTVSSDIAGSAESAVRPDPLTPRVVVTGISPDFGPYCAKAAIGDVFSVEADILTDGHEVLAVALLYRAPDAATWEDLPMSPLGNDRWRGDFQLERCGVYHYAVRAWRDAYWTWLAQAKAKRDAGHNVQLELEAARSLLEGGVAAAASDNRQRFAVLLADFDAATSTGERMALLESVATRTLFYTAAPRPYVNESTPELSVRVERKRAAFSAWYELTPRSQANDVNRHGTLRDVIARLPYVREMGFDVLYLTPIHPIGQTNRKGRNNALIAEDGDPGSPYAIGSAVGGHDAIHPELGDFADFADLVDAAQTQGLELALDFAIQCSPDHPWIKTHPEWFDWLPDGTIRFAENPPKKYEDIVNVHFYGEAFPSVWLALRDVVLFWVERGVKIFRVDNPHTKPFPFWEWLIEEVQRRDPAVIFLAEAFTRPKIMEELARIGFTQSYSYFTWRNTKRELTEYVEELTQGPTRHVMRPNFFVNTPDINPFYLQGSGRPGFRVRLVLAASLSSNYGVYSGFELCEAAALPDKEEYANSEKYQLKAWNWNDPANIREDIKRMNTLRRDHPALQQSTNVKFYNAWNDNILYYGKATRDLDDFLLFAVNLDPHARQGAHFEIPLWEFGLSDEASIEAEDLVSGQRFSWTGKVQHMLLDPEQNPYMIWRLCKPGSPA